MLFVLPVAAARRLELEPFGRAPAEPAHARPGRGAARELPEGDIVYSDLETSYRIAASAPVYIAAAPPSHVADTTKNRPYERRLDNIDFFADGDLAIPQRYGADWLVVDRSRFDLQPDLPVVYRDGRYTLYRLP